MGGRGWRVVIALMLSGVCSVTVSSGARAAGSDQPFSADAASTFTAGPYAPDDTTATAYAGAHHVGFVEARRRLELQIRAHDIVRKLREALGPAYGGVWFDNTVGRFRIGVPEGSDQASASASARAVSRSLQIEADADVISVASTWDGLLAEKARINGELLDLLGRGLLRTSMDAARNRVSVVVAPTATSSEMERVNTASDSAGVAVSVRRGDKAEFPVFSAACTFPHCDRPLRGGVEIFNAVSACSAGYLAIENGTGRQYMLTAGHCGVHASSWSAVHATTQTDRAIGWMDAGVWNWNGDVARIDATGSFWQIAGWAPRSAFWGINEAYPTWYEGWSVQGEFGCRTGKSETPAQCGTILGTVVDGVTYKDTGVTVGSMFEVDVCANVGDSGGPFMLNYYAVGILGATSNECVNGGESRSYFTEVMNAQALMNVHLAMEG